MVSVYRFGLLTDHLSSEACPRRPLRGNKATLFQGGVRGTGFIWGKMLASPGRLSTVMMHNIDWGPTLISAAGGDGGALAANKTLMLVRKNLFCPSLR